MLMKLRNVVGLSISPMSVCHPIPFVALLVYSWVGGSGVELLQCLIFTFVFLSAVNLWNHYNDVVEDSLSRKRTILAIDVGLRRTVGVLSIVLYLVALIVVMIGSNVLVFLPSLIVTWLYSDRALLGDRRLKNHYITETLTYIVAVPSYVLTLWLFFSNVNLRAILVAVAVTSLMLSGTFLKDIGDYTGDRSAGLRTLAVVCTPSLLLKLHYVTVWFYYITILSGVVVGAFTKIALLALIPSILTIYTSIGFQKSGWRLTSSTVRYLKSNMVSILLSLLLLMLSGFLSPTWRTFLYS